MKKDVKIEVDTGELDEALVKAERLVCILKEAEKIINSLAERK